MTNFDALTDEQLINQYKTTGCQDAFTTLYKRYQRLIESISRNQARAAAVDVNEFISALNMTFWRCVERFDLTRGTFKPYVHTALKLTAIDLYRAERDKRTEDVDAYVFPVEDDAMRQAEFKTDIEAAVKGDKLMAEVVKRYMAGYSFEELARELGTYRMKIQRKIKRLAKAVSG